MDHDFPPVCHAWQVEFDRVETQRLSALAGWDSQRGRATEQSAGAMIRQKDEVPKDHLRA